MPRARLNRPTPSSGASLAAGLGEMESQALESRFPDADFSRMRLIRHLPWWMFLGASGVRAITLGRRIYVGTMPEELIERSRLLVHEIVHAEQYRRLGIPRFLARYLGEYCAGRWNGLSHAAAYHAISFEREARAAEQDCPTVL